MADPFSTLMDTLEARFRDTAGEEAADTARDDWEEEVRDQGMIIGYRQQLWQALIDDGEGVFEDYDFEAEIGDIDTTLADIAAGLKDEAKARMLAWLDEVVQRITRS